MSSNKILFAVEEIDDRARELILAAGGRIDSLHNGKYTDVKEFRYTTLVEMPKNTECAVRHGSISDLVSLSFSMNSDEAQVYLELSTDLNIHRTELRFVNLDEESGASNE